jgi:hypothetical protein
MGHGVYFPVITEKCRVNSGWICYDVGGILGGDFLETSIGKCTNQGSRRSLSASLRLEGGWISNFGLRISNLKYPTGF